MTATPSIAPTLDDLRHDLRRAETELECADMIDDQPTRLRELAHWRARIEAIEGQITRIQEVS